MVPEKNLKVARLVTEQATTDQQLLNNKQTSEMSLQSAPALPESDKHQAKTKCILNNKSKYKNWWQYLFTNFKRTVCEMLNKYYYSC